MLELPIALSALALLVSLWALYMAYTIKEMAVKNQEAIKADLKEKVTVCLTVETKVEGDPFIVMSAMNLGHRPVNLRRSYFLLPGGRELADDDVKYIGDDFPVDLFPGKKYARVFRGKQLAKLLKDELKFTGAINLSGVMMASQGKLFVSAPLDFHIEQTLEGHARA